MATETRPCRIIRAQRMEYAQALALMRALAGELACGQGMEALILTEHEPVITLGHRPEASRGLKAGPGELARQGVGLHQVERGGLATYHGPGQLMIYPIFRLKGLGVKRFVNLLEEAVIRMLAGFGCQAWRRQGRPGVWTELGKIASLGLAVRQGVSLHGVGLNINTRLENFELINPCGVAGARMTSLAKHLGREVEMGQAQDAAAEHITATFGLCRHETGARTAPEEHTIP